MTPAAKHAPVSVETQIMSIRGHRVMLDADLAELYGVSTKLLNQAVRRNVSRFPLDFMFQLSTDEAGTLRSQIATSTRRHGGTRYQPYAFTEHGVATLATVLRCHASTSSKRSTTLTSWTSSLRYEPCNHR